MASPTGRILTVNAGSSSLKLRILDAENRVVSSRDSGSVQGQEELRNELAAILAEGGTVDAAGLRVVHGGPDHDGPVVLDASVEEDLGRLADLAPLHNPPALEGIRALEAELPGLPNVACFDTAFHAHLPEAASTYAVPCS